MTSEIPVTNLIQLGNDIISIKMYAISVAALWTYDYLLTLEDEIAYGWKRKNMFIFVLFLIARYLPVPFLVWIITSSWSPSYTAELCQRTVFIEVVYFALITMTAHVVLTLEVYAITGKNKWIAGGLFGLSSLQLGVGVYLCIYTSIHHLEIPLIDLDAYRICLFSVPKFGSLLFTSFSLAFDLGAFLIVLTRMRASMAQRCNSNIPNILDTMTRDAAIYFSVIFSSHFVLVLMLIFVRPSLRLLPTVGNAIFVPMMIIRIILSLKKAASTPQKYGTVENPNRSRVVSQELREPQGIQEPRNNQDRGALSPCAEYIQLRSGSSNA